MKFGLTLAAVSLLVSSAFASENRMEVVKVKRQAEAAPTDVEILNYALTLEYLERDFYAQGLAKFNKAAFLKAGYSGTVYERIKQIGQQEADHVSFLAGALGAAAVGECKYNFPLTDIPTFLTVARVLEGVGVTAYLGAAPDITEPAYLAAAGSILTVEARHSSYLNEAFKASGFPTAYDAALTYSEVYSLAAPFIVPGTCGTSGSLPPGIKAYPTLKIKNPAVKVGGRIPLQFKSPAGYTGPYYAVFIQGAQTLSSPIGSNGVAAIPKSLVAGIFYVIVSQTETLTDAATLAGPAYGFLA